MEIEREMKKRREGMMNKKEEKKGEDEKGEMKERKTMGSRLKNQNGGNETLSL